MRLKHYFLIYLAVFAIGFTTIDRLNDAVEVISAQTISGNILTTNFAEPHHPCSTAEEVFCDFPMIAKSIIVLSVTIISFFIFLTALRFRPVYYHQERFRPPAAVIV